MRFDRERAHQVLYETDTTVAHWADDALDRLEECVQPDPRIATMYQLDAEWKRAEAKLSKIRAFSSLEAERPDHWRGQDYMDGRTAVAESILEILG